MASDILGRKEDGTGFGFACMPEKKVEFRESISIAIRYAKALRCPRLVYLDYQRNTYWLLDSPYL